MQLAPLEHDPDTLRPIETVPTPAGLIDEISFGVVELDRDGAVLSANPAARALLEGTGGNLVAATLAEMAERVCDAEGHVEARIRAAASEVRLLVARTAGDGCLAYLERDTSRPQRLQVQILRTMLAAVCEDGSPAVAGSRALVTLAWVMPGTHLVLYEIHEESKTLVCLAQARVPPGQSECLVPQPLAADSPAARAVVRAMPVHIAAPPGRDGVAYSTLALPVKIGDRVLGALYACGPADAMNESELRLLQGLADAAGSLLLRARQEAALEAERAVRRALEQEQERARGAALEREALATVGKLTSCIAHEINSPLAFMRTNLHVLGEHAQRLGLMALGKVPQADPGESLGEIAGETRDIVKECLEGLDRIASIISMLKGLARSRQDEQMCFAPGKPVQDAVYMFSRARSGDGQVDLELEKDLPELTGSPVALAQLVLNLLENALDAMGGRGTVSVHASAAGRGVRIQVSDHGPGIPEEIWGRVFEPYFTTKPVGKGTGLGLYICREIVERMGGRIGFETGPGGTTFTVEFPAAGGE